MLGFNDRFTLTATNAINKQGEELDYYLKLPIENDAAIPKDIIQISIAEYHMGHGIHGTEAFKIYIGKTINVDRLCHDDTKDVEFRPNVVESVDTPEDELCYFDSEDGKHIIFAKVNHGDIVVDNIDELKEALMVISKEYKNIEASISRIRMYKKRLKAKKY